MSAKNVDRKNRIRSKIVAFRMSPKESEILDARVLMSGFRTKHDYLIQSDLNTNINAYGNPYMFIQFRKHLENIIFQLEKIDNYQEIDEELLYPLYIMIEIIKSIEDNFKKEKLVNGNGIL